MSVTVKSYFRKLANGKIVRVQSYDRASLLRAMSRSDDILTSRAKSDEHSDHKFVTPEQASGFPVDTPGKSTPDKHIDLIHDPDSSKTFSEVDVVAMIHSDFAASTQDVADHFGISKGRARTILNKLEAKGVIGGFEMNESGWDNGSRARGKGGYIDKTWQYTGGDKGIDDTTPEEARAFAIKAGASEDPIKPKAPNLAPPKPVTDNVIKRIHNAMGSTALTKLENDTTEEHLHASHSADHGRTMGEQANYKSRLANAKALDELSKHEDGLDRMRAFHDARVAEAAKHIPASGLKPGDDTSYRAITDKLREAEYQEGARKQATALRRLQEQPPGVVRDALASGGTKPAVSPTSGAEDLTAPQKEVLDRIRGGETFANYGKYQKPISALIDKGLLRQDDTGMGRYNKEHLTSSDHTDLAADVAPVAPKPTSVAAPALAATQTPVVREAERAHRPDHKKGESVWDMEKIDQHAKSEQEGDRYDPPVGIVEDIRQFAPGKYEYLVHWGDTKTTVWERSYSLMNDKNAQRLIKGKPKRFVAKPQGNYKAKKPLTEMTPSERAAHAMVRANTAANPAQKKKWEAEARKWRARA